jgi:hypothetical protein
LVFFLKLIDAGEKGNGLRTKVDIKKGSFIIEYVGEIIDIADCAERMANARHFYFLTIDAKLGRTPFTSPFSHLPCPISGSVLNFEVYDFDT